MQTAKREPAARASVPKPPPGSASSTPPDHDSNSAVCKIIQPESGATTHTYRLPNQTKPSQPDGPAGQIMDPVAGACAACADGDNVCGSAWPHRRKCTGGFGNLPSSRAICDTLATGGQRAAACWPAVYIRPVTLVLKLRSFVLLPFHFSN